MTQAILFTPSARDAQANFREALDCLSRPGSIGKLTSAAFPAPRARHAYALLLALADQEVSIAVSGGDETLARFASLGTGSRQADWQKALYVLCLQDPDEQLLTLRRGTDELPEDGATAILCVQSLAEGQDLRLSGPGIDGNVSLSVSGLSATSVVARNQACESYPLGIDLFLVDPEGRLAGIPRTTRITMEGN